MRNETTLRSALPLAPSPYGRSKDREDSTRRSHPVTGRESLSKLATMVALSTFAGLLVGLAQLTSPSISHAALGECSQPATDAERPLSSDCLFILRAAVQIEECLPACVCATKGTFPITASDALNCLRFAVGQDVELDCPCGFTVTEVSPVEGTIGTTLTINGGGFTGEDSGSRGSSNDVRLFLSGAIDVPLEVIQVSEFEATARVSSAIPAGDYMIKAVRPDATIVSDEMFSVRLPDALTFEPAISRAGERVTMRGAFLGTAPGTVELTARNDPGANQVEAQVLSWNNDEVVFIMSPGLTVDGPLDVTVTNPVGARTTGVGVSLDGGPRVVSAVATSNTEVIVQFSEALEGGMGSAENPAHYRINGETKARIPTIFVTSAELIAPANSSVLLTTVSQADLLYRLTATNIFDLNGNPIAAPSEQVDPTNTTFVGMPPSGEAIDSDGDGLTDSDEQRGWYVTIYLDDDAIETYHVTSDPGDPRLAIDHPTNIDARDTDQDGVADNEEKHALTDPRSPDTDGDTLTDNEEWNVIYSDPKNQDSDGDGTQDGFEFYSYRTSPLLADTDGDQISDTDEVTGRNRDPRIADIPLAEITIGEVRLQIDERYTYEDGTGKTVTTESVSTSTLTETETRKNSSSETLVLEAQLNLGTEFEPPFGVKINVGVQLRGSYTFQTSRETAIESQEVHERSLTKGEELSSTSNVTREIVGASITVDATLRNEGDLAFAISNVEITVRQRDPQSASRLIPVATLIPNTTLLTGEPAEFNLGPFSAERGPILFTSFDAFPNLVEDLMQAPSGLVFEVSNFDMTDEFGRVFSFSNQIARDRTAGVILDYGDGTVERHLVATALQPDPDGYGTADKTCNVDSPSPGASCTDDIDCAPGGACTGAPFVGGFNPDGSPVGIPIDFALQDILGLAKGTPGQCAFSSRAAGTRGVASTDGCDGIVAGLDGTADSTAQGDDIQLIPNGTTGLSPGSIVIGAGRNGTLESTPTGDDVADVTTGYETGRVCTDDAPRAGQPCASDAECDDLTGACNSACVFDEDCASGQAGCFCTDRDEMGDCLAAICDDDGFAGCPDQTGWCSPETLVRVGGLRTGDFNRKWAVLTTGDIPAGADFNQIVLDPGMDLILAFVQDLDSDGLFAREEFLEGSTDSAADRYDNDSFGIYFDEDLVPVGGDGIADSKDTDRDGLGDFTEVRVGWKVDAGAGILRQVYSSPRLRDSDGEGLLDPQERDLRAECINGNRFESAFPAMCAYLDEPAVEQADAIAIIAGPNGRADTVAALGDEQVIPQGSDCKACYNPDERLAFDEVIIRAGSVALGFTEGIQTGVLGGDDLYVSANSTPPPATDPSLSDTDADGLEDKFELDGYLVGFGLRDGGNRVSDTFAAGDDIQKVPFGHPVGDYGIVILPGPNGKVDTVPGGDERVLELYAGSDSIFQSQIAGDDQRFGEFIRTGPNGILDTVAKGDDYPTNAGGPPVSTDPLRMDSDSDLVADGRERELGGDPTDPSDGSDFVDSDLDGLTDQEETELGWNIFVNGAVTPLRVFSNPSRPDSDFDGLPDLIERDLRTNPHSVDTDNDGLYDYDEFARFEDYVSLVGQFPGLEIDGSASARYGTNPFHSDSDGDSCSDDFELIRGFDLLLPGGEVRHTLSDPLKVDTDRDGTNDCFEYGSSDPSDPDTDDDGTVDGLDANPLIPDLSVTIRALNLNGSTQKTGPFVWYFTTKGSGDANPGLLFSANNITPRPGYDAYVGLGGSCAGWQMLPFAEYVLPASSGSRTYNLKEGESFTLTGIMGQADSISADCGLVPFYVPSYITDTDGCVETFNQTFTYDDFLGGGGTGTSTLTLNGKSCSFQVDFSLTVN